MKKFSLLVLILILVLASSICIGIFSKNNDVTPTTPTATTAPTAKTNKANQNDLPTATATVRVIQSSLNLPTVAPTVAPKVTSFEISNNTIVIDDEGKIRQMMVFEADLKKVEYEEVDVDEWNGVKVNANSIGIVGEIYSRESFAKNKLNAGIREERIIENFFDANGNVFSSSVREGYSLNSEIGLYNLTNVRFVKIENEAFYRLVVIGSRAGSSDGPTSKPLPDPEPTLTPGGNNNPTAKPTMAPLPDPDPTWAPGGSNNPLNGNVTEQPTSKPTAKPTSSSSTSTDGWGNGGSNSALPKPDEFQFD